MSELEIVQSHTRVGVIDIIAILDDLGVPTRCRPMATGITCSISRPGRYEWVIEINSDLPDQRRRFAAAHALVHYLMHRDLIEIGKTHVDMLFTPERRSTTGGLGPSEDSAANQFACQIMLPGDRIREAWANLDAQGQNAKVRAIAVIFGVNAATMTIRLQTLGMIGYMLWMKGIVGLQPNPTPEDIARDASRWYTINESGNRSGPCRYDTPEEAARDGKARLHSGRTDYAVTEYDTTRESWDVFERPADAIDTETPALGLAA